MASTGKSTSHIYSNMYLGSDANGSDLRVYGDTTSKYLEWDASDNALEFANASLAFGTLSSTTQTGVTLSASKNEVLEVYADDGNATLGNAVYSTIRSRTMLFKDAAGISLFGIHGQLKAAAGVDFGTGVYAASHGYIELVGDTQVTASGHLSCYDASIEVASTKTLTTTGTAAQTSGLRVELTGAGAVSEASNGIISGVLIDSTAGTAVWPVGVRVKGSATTTGIDIGICTTGINFSGDMTTGISMTSSLSATDAILIAGANADAIHISGSNTTAALHISGDQAIGILYDADASATDGLKISVDDSMTVTTGINICRSGTTGICTTGLSIDTDGTTGISIGSGFTGVDMIVLNGTASGYGIEISGTCTTADLILQNGATINNDAAGSLTITEDSISLVAGGASKLIFGGVTDWGTGATGTLIDGTGWDWVSQTVGRVNANLNSTAAAAAYHALSVTASQTSSNSVFGTWTELYFSNSVSMAAADNAAAVWAQVEAGTSFTAPATAGDFVSAVYANVKAGATFTTGADAVVNGVRVKGEISTTTISHAGRLAAFECLTGSGNQPWDYGVYVTGANEGVYVGGSIAAITGRGFHAAITQNTANHGDGYGANELDVTLTGTSGGHVAALSSWINVTAGTHGTGGAYVAAQTNGVYEASGADVSAAKVIAGMRMQYQGDEQPARLYMLSMHSPNRPITSMWEVSSFHNDVGVESGGGETSPATAWVRFMSDNGGNVKYIRLYDAIA